MNIKVKEDAGSFEQSFAKMLDKIYGNNGNVKVEVKKTHDGTLYTVLSDFDQVDFLFKTDKGTKAPTCDITIGGDTLFTKTGDPKKKVKTYYGLFDKDPTILRSFQQILQKYIDGVDLDLPWLRFEESKASEAKRNYYGYSKDEPIDKEDGDFMFQVAFDWFTNKLRGKLKEYADKATNMVIDKDMDSYEEIETMDDYYDYLEKYGPDVVEEIKNDHADESKKNETNSPEEEAVKKVLMDASADAEFRREAGKDFSAEDFEKSIDANIEKLRNVFLEVLYFDDGSFKCDVNDHEETRELCSFVASKVAYILGLPDSVATAIDGYLLWYVVQENIVSDESKKSEADYSTSRVSKSIADAYKVLDDYYCDNDGSLRKGFVNQIMTTFVNDRDLYTRSQSKAVKSHSLAWDVLCRQINAHLEWDDETPHATKLTSEQVKNWFKLKGRDFKEDLKPLVDAIDAYRNKKESKGESMKNEANIEDLRDQSVSHGTMHPKHLIPVFLDVLKTYAPEKYNAYVKENPEVLDLDGIDDETLGYVVEELFDKLNEIAPDGTYFGSHPGDGSDYGFWSVDPDESKCGKDKDDKGNDGKDGKPDESAKPVKNILRRRFEVLTKSVLKACDNLAKDASLAGDFDDELIYAEDAVKNAVESFNEMGNAIIRLKTVLEHHKNEDNMDVIGILSDAITKIVADEQGDELDSETAGADSVIDQVEKEYSGETENEPEANGGENEAPNPAENEPPTEF